ncbi:hypothetical protein B0H14DRAFT_1389109 [Mycena olivaceomarginata]|nr:hypothetical protein B0H14DRAFT_1389109 [Mycena olivaceomarginata]
MAAPARRVPLLSFSLPASSYHDPPVSSGYARDSYFVELSSTAAMIRRHHFLLPLRRSAPPSPSVIMAAPPPSSCESPTCAGSHRRYFCLCSDTAAWNPHARLSVLLTRILRLFLILMAPCLQRLLCVTLPLLRIRRSALPPRMISPLSHATYLVLRRRVGSRIAQPCLPRA